VELDFVVAFVDAPEVVAHGTVVEFVEVVDYGIAAESVELGIAAAVVAAAVLALDIAPAVPGIVAAVEFGLDNVVVMELEVDRVAVVAPGPGIAVAVCDLPSVAAVPVPDTAKDDIAEAVIVADTMETVEQNDMLKTNNIKFAKKFAKCFTALRLLTWFC